MIGGFDGELHFRPPAPDEWCIVEIVGLLGDIESRYRGRFERIVSEDTPQVPAIWPSPMPDPLPQLSNVVAVFEHERAKTVAFLETLALGAWQRGANHATLGSITLLKQVQGLIDHDEEHLKQILQTLMMLEVDQRSE